MITAKVIRIGNSQGIRIPKTLLDQINLGDGKLELRLENGTIRIVPLELRRAAAVTPELLAAERSLGKDWNRPEEDKAWAYLQ